MPIPIFPPRKDSELLTWSDNFSSHLTTSAVSFGLDATQASGFAALQLTYSNAYTVATNPNTNSKANVNAKNDAKEQLLRGDNGAWELVDIVQAYPGTTDTIRGQLGLRIPDDKPTPVDAPTIAPALNFVSASSRSITIRLRDASDPTRWGKPDGVAGATIVYHVGDTAPTDPAEWSFGMNVTRITNIIFEFPASIAAGSTVWVTAFWFNRKAETGPAAQPPVSTVAGTGLAAAA